MLGGLGSRQCFVVRALSRGARLGEERRRVASQAAVASKSREIEAGSGAAKKVTTLSETPEKPSLLKLLVHAPLKGVPPFWKKAFTMISRLGAPRPPKSVTTTGLPPVTVKRNSKMLRGGVAGGS